MVRNFSVQDSVSLNLGQGLGVRRRSVDSGINSQIRIVKVFGALSSFPLATLANGSILYPPTLKIFPMVNRIHHRLLIPEI